MSTICTQMMQNMIKETITQLEKNGALKISTEEAFAIFEMEMPKRTGKGGRTGRPPMSRGEKAFNKLARESKAKEVACVKKAFKRWAKTNAAKKKAAEKAEKDAAKALEKGRKAAEKAEKDAAKALEKERKAAEKAEKDALKLLAQAEKEAVDAIAALKKRPKGRSPKGKAWDAEKGEWVPEISLRRFCTLRSSPNE